MNQRRIKHRFIILLLLLVGPLGLINCGVRGDNRGNSGGGIHSGRFIDSAVEGLHYISGSKSGLTDGDGTFLVEGTTVQFSIGDILLGEGIAKSIMTPIDLVPGAIGASDPRVTNITRFLLTLDDDADPSNGIQITQALQEAAIEKSLDFSQSTTSFEEDATVRSIIEVLTTLTSAGAHGLVSSLAAQTHLSNTLLGIKSFTLTVITTGKGSGTVSSVPEGIKCGLECSEIYNEGTSVTLMATPDDGSTFVGWDGDPDCAGGVVNLTENKTCMAIFQDNAVMKIATGGEHTCALFSKGTLKCWGRNDNGQLGNGITGPPSPPVEVSGINTAIDITVGLYHSCALLTDGRVFCWGQNFHGQLGNGTTIPSLPSPSPVEVIGIDSAISIDAGEAHTCAVLSDATIRCWGSAGLSTRSTSTPEKVLGINTATATVTAIAAGNAHTCALLSDHTVQCWGSNEFGQLGDGGKAIFPGNFPVSVIGINTATALSAGRSHTCALLSDGTIQCWGYNREGQLGNGTVVDSLVPVQVNGIDTASKIALGGNHTCALLSNHTVQCWGKNREGQLGDGTFEPSLTPVAVSNINTGVALSVGGVHTCVVLSDGTAQCWGSNRSNQLGDGTLKFSSSPVPVSGIKTVTAVAAGHSHTCALLSNGTIQCWGSIAASSTPVEVIGIDTATAIASGAHHTCAILSDKTVQCWGEVPTAESFFPIIPPLDFLKNPVPVTGIDSATAIALGNNRSCIVLFNGTVECWGHRLNLARLPGSRGTFFSETPSPVQGINMAKSISVGRSHSCALLSDSTLQCWGENKVGQLGKGTNLPIPILGPVIGIHSAIAITAKKDHTCIGLSEGTLQCWGGNEMGQLGNGSVVASSTPVSVVSIDSAIAISTGVNHTCTVLFDGTIQCWGGNEMGQLGNGTTVSSKIPTETIDINTAQSIDVGHFHACAVLSDGMVQCWGDNKVGQLGIGGNPFHSSTPAPVLGL